MYYLPPAAPEEKETTEKVGLLPGLSTVNAASKGLSHEPEPPQNSKYKNTSSKSFYSLT